MKIWRFSDPVDDSYARASRRGTWEGTERVQPLVIEWEPGSDVIGDFTWPGFDSDIVVTNRVAEVFRESQVAGVELGPVEMVESAEDAQRRSRKRRVTLPYQGPALWDLWVTTWVRADVEQSSIRVVRDASSGTEHYEVEGAERWEAVWDPDRMELVKKRHPRVPGQGLLIIAGIAGDSLRGATIFRVAQFPAWIFCTDAVRELVEKNQFSNVSFLEMGETLE